MSPCCRLSYAKTYSYSSKTNESAPLPHPNARNNPTPVWIQRGIYFWGKNLQNTDNKQRNLVAGARVGSKRVSRGLLLFFKAK